MRIKVKYIVKWFIMLFPLILFFTLYLKMGDELFARDEEFFFKNVFLSFMSDTAECCGSLIEPISRLVRIFVAPDFDNGLFLFFDDAFPCYNFRGCIIFCLTWLILMWIFWELLELFSHFWHKLTRTEEE